MERKWWHGKTAYQIYPKSFCDSNGDGIGDLRGIISKLDYLKELGIDIVWISPIYRSPQADQGYDISDYYSIDPRFGTMEEMDELLAKSKERGIRVIMDLVVNHCSDEHEWFQKACQDPDGKYGKYFYIEDWHEGDPLPCNWRSAFGGSVWSKLPGHDSKVYFHTFHRKQPDLNWENPEVRQEIYKMINWWLDKGLAGFRVDAIINIKKKIPYKNYPADRDDGLSSLEHMLADTHGVIDFLDEMAENTFRKYDAFTPSEVCDEKEEELPMFIGEHGVFSTMFDFSQDRLDYNPMGWYASLAITPERYKDACFYSQKRVENIGFLCNIIENHDESRGVSRYLPKDGCTPAGKKMLGGLNFMLRGMPFIFQGQELGMENRQCVSIDEVDDVSARNQYQVALDAGLTQQEAMAVLNLHSRDNGRTPFQWDSTESAGFTTGTPWLQVNPNYKEINLAAQKDDPDSVWNFYRKLIALRKNPDYYETVIYGRTEPYLSEQKNLMAYYRRGEGQSLLVIGNFQKETQDMVLPGKVKAILINNLSQFNVQGSILHLAPWQFVVLDV